MLSAATPLLCALSQPSSSLCRLSSQTESDSTSHLWQKILDSLEDCVCQNHDFRSKNSAFSPKIGVLLDWPVPLDWRPVQIERTACELLNELALCVERKVVVWIRNFWTSTEQEREICTGFTRSWLASGQTETISEFLTDFSSDFSSDFSLLFNIFNYSNLIDSKCADLYVLRTFLWPVRFGLEASTRTTFQSNLCELSTRKFPR